VIQDREVWQSRGDHLTQPHGPQDEFASPRIDLALYAQACGATGLVIDDPEHCRRILEQAFATPGPVLVEARVDPQEKPVPPI
jgi:pyruvate dehydrogenase (quinone)